MIISRRISVSIHSTNYMFLPHIPYIILLLLILMGRVALIPKKTEFLTNFARVVSTRLPTGDFLVQRILKITFVKITRTGIRQITTTGYSRKSMVTSKNLMVEDVELLEDEAFKFANAQITFSWDRFIIRDRAWLWFRPLDGGDEMGK